MATLSHEFITPITAALMNLQLLIRKKGEYGALELYSGRAIDNLSRLSAMIQDLLDANRIKAGHNLPIKIMGPLNLNQVIQETLDSITAIHGERFRFEVNGPIEGFWDILAVQRMIENLCSNAIKYGHITCPITVSLRRLPNNQVEIKVHNEGIPIPEEDQSKLFQQFQKVGAATYSSQKGWGIGLVLVRGMAEAHGETIHVESSKETGSSFIIKLPLDLRPFQNIAH